MRQFIPKSAPFTEDEIGALNRVVGPATPVQRAWLAGFLAGLDAAQGAPQVQHPAAPPRAQEPLTILYASESGNCERLAADTAKAARKLGMKPTLLDMADLDVAALASVRRLVVIAATWGEGDPPSRAIRGYGALMGEGAPRLENLEFGVLALGDTAYVEFCAIGKAIDARLEALGGRRVVDRSDLDLDFAAPAASWIGTALEKLAPKQAESGSVIAVDFGARHAAETDAELNLGPFEAEVIEHVNLNSSRSDKETFHLALGFEQAPAYEPGDSLDLFVENDPALVDEILVTAGRNGDDALRKEFVRERDVSTLSQRTVETFVAETGHADAKALLASGNIREWLAGRQLIDLLEAFPSELSSEGLRKLTRPLAPRAYSIASSRREAGEEAHLLIAKVAYETYGRARAGVASGHVASRLRTGAKVRAKLRPNNHFRLPAPDRDIIMVGPGTGIAPFRAFMQERRAVEATGRSWLVFGDRRFTHDFLYQLEWQDALKDGALTRMDIAFSRDAPEKVYVQNRLWQNRRDLVEWLDGGAHFYVCGDAKAMAKDVRKTLVDIHADVKGISPEKAEEAVQALESGRRYLQDVY
jgi:sulfite reductase (NADPH) flavoprotein alpha-component